MKLLIIILFASFGVYSQTGWELISQNKLSDAKIEFEKVLEKDSANYDALTGMIFITEVAQDKLIHKRAVNTLLRNHYSDKLYYCLQNSASIDRTELEDRSFRFKIYDMYDEAFEYFEERKFEKSKEKYAKVNSPFIWSYLGPFQNINGYGYVKEFEVENQAYNKDKVYENAKNQSLKWVEPKYHHPKFSINFKRHLGVSYKNAVTFANSFFTTDKDQDVYIRVARNSPIKIWLDDQLVFGQDNAINYDIDAEYVKLNLKKGAHRLFIKSVVGDYFDGDLTSRSYGTSYDLYQNYSGGIDVMKSMEVRSKNKFINVIRLTDEAGKPINITSNFEVKPYQKGSFSPEFTEDNFIIELQKEFDEYKKGDAPSKLFNLYLLHKASLEHGNLAKMEEYFYLKHKANDESVFYKYIAAKIFMINGKREKGYYALDGIDLKENPIYVTYSDKLKEIDPINDAEAFVPKLEQLLKIAPTNLDLIKLKGNYLKEEGKMDSLKVFVENIMETYPEYDENYSLELLLDEDYKPYDYDMNNDFESDDKKDLKEAKKNITKRFVSWDYRKLIKKYKKDGKEEKVLALYNELIEIEPYKVESREDKAKYLFNLERYDEALAALDEILTINPRESSVYGLKGDIYFDQKKEDEALENYLVAIDLGGETSYFDFSTGANVQEKIDKIKGKTKLKEKFEEKSFENWMNDRSWVEQAKEEESLILGYSTDLHYDKKGKANLYSKIMILILTEAGASSWVQYDFSRMGSIDVVKVIKENGSEQIPDVRRGFVVFKTLEPGDVIQLEASSKWTPSNDLGNNLIFFNYASFHAPIIDYKMEAAFPEGKKINILTHKLKDKHSKSTKDGMDFYKWEYRNLPKSTFEEAIIDDNDIYANIQISTIEDWSKVVNWYHAKTYRKLDSKYEIREVLDTLIKDGMTEMEKTIAVYNYVTKEINYSFTSLLNSNYIPKNADLTCSSKIGDCKDVATVMINMLNELDIDAYYVLVKTNSYFDMQIAPSLYFNHVIAGVEMDGKQHYFDLTTNNYPYTVTNISDSYAWALKVRGEEEELFRLPNDYINVDKNMMEFEIHAAIDKDHLLDVEVDVVYHGINAGYVREKLKSLPRNEMENIVLSMIGDDIFSNIQFESYEFYNIDDISDPLKGKYKFKAKKYSDHILDIYFMNIPFMNVISNSVVFASDKRMNTINLNRIIDAAPTKETLYFSYPSNLKLYKLPKDIHMENEYFSYDVKFSKEKGELKVVKTQIFFKQRIEVEEFEVFKDKYLELNELDQTKIVLIGKNSSMR
ncbi:MAG: DUF3857 domain-containing protein [Fluviicola sp.]|nr:DUF3857 domain-containing protein [Fluviicola sp.]